VLYVADRGGLAGLAARLKGARRLAVDTEFVGEDTYVPRLEIVQIGDGAVEAIVDYRALGTLGDLGELLLDPAIEKVMHAGGQDLAIFAGILGQPPAPVFDAQVAAAMIGYGAQAAYAALVQRVLHRHVAKAETVSNWGQRPLTAAQLAYAREDIRYLLPLAEHLEERLAHLGRTEWAREEFQRLADPNRYRAPDDRLRYTRVRDRGKLSRRGLGILRELAAWREAEARRRDLPRGRVVADEVLVEIARLAPHEAAALRGLRRLGPGAVERYREAILEAVARGQATPERDLPRERAGPRQELPAGLVDLLQAFLQARAEQEHLATSVLASVADLHALAEAHGAGDLNGLPILEGWRRELAGEDLLALLQGRAALAVEPATGRVHFLPRP
jgi:ribonuclease D